MRLFAVRGSNREILYAHRSIWQDVVRYECKYQRARLFGIRELHSGELWVRHLLLADRDEGSESKARERLDHGGVTHAVHRGIDELEWRRAIGVPTEILTTYVASTELVDVPRRRERRDGRKIGSFHIFCTILTQRRRREAVYVPHLWFEIRLYRRGYPCVVWRDDLP